MKLYKLALSNNAPNVKDCIWAKPESGGFKLYMLEGGAWKELKTDIPEVTNITKLPAALLDKLKVGDKVVKITGNSKHLYTVTFKNETAGEMCLNYFDYENIEEVYYAKSDGVWGDGTVNNTSLLTSGSNP